jgi:hypothetical protein
MPGKLCSLSARNLTRNTTAFAPFYTNKKGEGFVWIVRQIMVYEQPEPHEKTSVYLSIFHNVE